MTPQRYQTSNFLNFDQNLAKIKASFGSVILKTNFNKKNIKLNANKFTRNKKKTEAFCDLWNKNFVHFENETKGMKKEKISKVQSYSEFFNVIELRF